MILLMTLEQLRHFLLRYFPVFAAANLFQIFALAIGVPMMFDSYFDALPADLNLKYSFLSTLGSACLLGHRQLTGAQRREALLGVDVE